MSLLADLLSKVKHEEMKADIPPDLRQRVKEGSKNRSDRKRFTTFLLIALLVVAAGFGAVYLTQFYLGTSTPPAKLAVRQTPPPPPQTPPSTTTPAPPPPATSAGTPAPPRTVPAAVIPPKETPKSASTGQTRSPAASLSRPQRVPAAKAGPGRDEGLARTDTTLPSPEAKASDRRAEKDMYLYGARNYEQSGAYHEALGEYRKALALDPENPVIMNNVASLLVRLNRYEDAATQAQRALRVRQDYVPALINLGLARIGLGQEVEGETSLLKAREMEPAHPQVLLNLALLYERKKAFDRATPLFRSLAEKANSQGYLGLARIAEKQGRTADAEALYREILAIDTLDREAKKLAAERLSLILHSR